MGQWIRFIIRNKRNVLVATAIFTCLLLSQLGSLKLIIDPDNILPRDHHFVKTNELIESIFGNKFTVVITVGPATGDIYQTEFLEQLKKLTSELEDCPGLIPSHFNGVAAPNAKALAMTSFGPLPSPLLDSVPTDQREMQNFKTRLHSDPIFEGLIYSKDEKTTQIIAEFSKIEGGFQAIEKNVNRILKPYREQGLDIRVGGLPIFLSELESFSTRMALLFPLALIIIGLIHYEAFRTMQALLLPLVTALLAVIWSVGFLGLLRESFDVFNASTPILILAIAAGHAVQILKRYYEEFHLLQSKHPEISLQEINLMAVEDSMTKVGPVMIVACIVAALGFFSLTIFEIKTIRTFGLFSGFGVLSALVIELTFIPALRATLRPPEESERHREAQETFWDRITTFFFNVAAQHRQTVYILAALLLIIFGYGAYDLKIDNSQKGYFFDSLKVKTDDAFINEKMAGTNLIYVLIDGSTAKSISQKSVLDGIEKTQIFLNEQDYVGKTISINNFIKRVHQVLSGDEKSRYTLPSDSNQAARLLDLITQDGKSENFSSWINSDQSKAVIATFIKTDSSAYIEHLTKVTRDFAQLNFPKDVKVDIGGGAVNGVALNEVLIKEKILNIAQIMLAVFVVTAIVFRSVVAGLLILVPLVAAVIVNFGIMGLLGIPLQIATALVSAMAVGIGADYGIYMSYRMREELKKSSDESLAIKKAFGSAGKATLFVSSAVAGGFGVLMISWGFYIHIWMGFLIATAMLTSSFAALTLFPSLIFSIRPKYIFDKK